MNAADFHLGTRVFFRYRFAEERPGTISQMRFSGLRLTSVQIKFDDSLRPVEIAEGNLNQIYPLYPENPFDLDLI